MRGERGNEVISRRGKVVKNDCHCNINQQPIKPQGYCDECGETVASKAPSCYLGELLFHKHCYEEYIIMQEVKRKLPDIIAIIKMAGYSETDIGINSKDFMIFSFKKAREVVLKIVNGVQQLFNKAHKVAVHLLNELYWRLNKLTVLLKLPEISFPAPAYDV